MGDYVGWDSSFCFIQPDQKNTISVDQKRERRGQDRDELKHHLISPLLSSFLFPQCEHFQGFVRECEKVLLMIVNDSLGWGKGSEQHMRPPV